MDRSNEQDNLKDLLKFYDSVRVASLEAIVDIQHARENQVIVNLDFSALYAYLLGQRDPATQRFDFAAIQLCEELIESQADLPFVAVITSPTFWEMLAAYGRAIKNHYGEIGGISSFNDHVEAKVRLVEKAMKDQATQQLINNDIDAEVSYLSRITGDRLSGGIARLRKLVGGHGPIRGLGEVFQKVSDVTALDSAAFEDLLNRMFSLRGPRDTGRNSVNKDFRYRVDCANILLSRSVSDSLKLGKRMDYVTKASYKTEFCNDVGRIPLSPLFWLRARKISDLRDNKDYTNFLSSIQRDAGQLFRELKSRDELPREGTALWATVTGLQARIDLLMNESGLSQGLENHADKLNRIKSRVFSNRSGIATQNYNLKGILDAASSIVGDELDLSTNIATSVVVQEIKSENGDII